MWTGESIGIETLHQRVECFRLHEQIAARVRRISVRLEHGGGVHGGFAIQENLGGVGAEVAAMNLIAQRDERISPVPAPDADRRAALRPREP